MAQMTDKELFANYKRTAPVGDARFFLRVAHHLTDAMRAELETLIATPPKRAEFYRRYIRVQESWRSLMCQLEAEFGAEFHLDNDDCLRKTA